MNTKTYIAIACSFVISKLHADSSQTSSPGSATSALETESSFGVIDLRTIIGNSLNVDSKSLQIEWGGMNASGSIWGGIVVDRNRTDGFVVRTDGSVERYVAPKNEGGRGDLPVPQSTVIHGVSAAGEVVYTQGRNSFVSYASGQTQPFVIEGTEYAQPVGVSESGSVAYYAERNGQAVFGQSNLLNVDEVDVDYRTYAYTAYEGVGVIAGARFDSYSNGYSAFLKAGGELINPFPLMTAHVVDVTKGGILGVHHEYDPQWGYSVLVDIPASAWVSSGATKIEGVLRTGSEVTTLTATEQFSIPFALSSDARTVVGTSFSSLEEYGETGRGTFTVWRNGTQSVQSVGGTTIRSVHDAIGITDSGLIAARVVGNDGVQSIGLAVPRSNELVVEKSIPSSVNVGSLSLVYEHSFGSVDVASLSGKRVVVLSHGWAPGQADAVTENRQQAWESHASWYMDVAASLRAEDPDVVVLGYDWMDGAATSSELTPRMSRANTDIAGYALGMVLKDVAGDAGSIEVIGHSHGSRVAVTAAAALEEVGVQVAAITLFDSPESPQSIAGIGSALSGGENLLERDLAAYGLRFGIGEGEHATKVINLYSSIGESYNVAGVTNAQLVAYDSIGSGHSYPIEWYAQGGRVPLDDGTYKQDSVTKEMNHIESDSLRMNPNLSLGVSSSMFASRNELHNPFELVSKRSATLYSLDARAAPARSEFVTLGTGERTWEALLLLPNDAQEVVIPYRFAQTNDKSYLSAWLGGEESGIAISGAANYAAIGDEDVLSGGAEDEGWRLLTVSTVGSSSMTTLGLSFGGIGFVEVGEISVLTRSFAVSSAPEPTRIVLMIVGVIGVCTRRSRKVFV